MLQAVGLSCRRGERRLFFDLNVKVERGKLLAVVGENGSGKTSLLRKINPMMRRSSFTKKNIYNPIILR